MKEKEVTNTNSKTVRNANRIIEALVEEPDRTWKKTQKDLSNFLGLSQPELSKLLSALIEAGKIRKGNPIPGVRGRNFTVELIDATPFVGVANNNQADNLAKLKELREQLSIERQYRLDFAAEKEKLEQELEQKDNQMQELLNRGEH